jgi:hypothetical protein
VITNIHACWRMCSCLICNKTSMKNLVNWRNIHKNVVTMTITDKKILCSGRGRLENVIGGCTLKMLLNGRIRYEIVAINAIKWPYQVRKCGCKCY